MKHKLFLQNHPFIQACTIRIYSYLVFENHTVYKIRYADMARVHV